MDLRDLYAHYANRCYDESSGVFVSLDQAVDGLKSGAVKFEHLSLRGPPDSKELLREFKTYYDCLRVINAAGNSERNERRK